MKTPKRKNTYLQVYLNNASELYPILMDYTSAHGCLSYLNALEQRNNKTIGVFINGICLRQGALADNQVVAINNQHRK